MTGLSEYILWLVYKGDDNAAFEMCTRLQDRLPLTSSIRLPTIRLQRPLLLWLFPWMPRFSARADPLVAELHVAQRLAKWASAALPAASNRIPQLFLFNSQTSEESRCKPHRADRKKDRREAEKTSRPLMKSALIDLDYCERKLFFH